MLFFAYFECPSYAKILCPDYLWVVNHLTKTVHVHNPFFYWLSFLSYTKEQRRPHRIHTKH